MSIETFILTLVTFIFIVFTVCSYAYVTGLNKKGYLLTYLLTYLKRELLRYIDFDQPNIVSILGFTFELEHKQVFVVNRIY